MRFLEENHIPDITRAFPIHFRGFILSTIDPTGVPKRTESAGLKIPWFCQTDTKQTTMKVLIFPLIVLLVLCYYVTSQSVSSPVPTRTLTPIAMPVPTPTPTPTTSPFSHPLDCPFVDTSLCDPLCPYINFECEPGLVPSTRTFSQSDICIFDTDFIGTCSFVMSNGTTVGLKC